MALAGLAALVGCWTRCPVEIRPVRVQPVEVVDDADANMWMVTVNVRNRSTRAVGFDYSAELEARVKGRWVKAPGIWTVGELPARATRQAMLVIPRGADCCRVRLKFRYGRRQLPLGIGQPFARYYPPSKVAARIQRITKRVSPALYNRLWPPGPSANLTPPPWRRTTAKVSLR